MTTFPTCNLEHAVVLLFWRIRKILNPFILSCTEPGEDPFLKLRESKKERVSKQEKNQLENLKRAAKQGGKGALPRFVFLSILQYPLLIEV